MRLFDADRCDTCNGQYLCKQDCITGNILVENGFPCFKQRGYCINCGHCEAICHSKAIRNDHTGKNEIKQEYDIDRLYHEMLMKRTVRRYDGSRQLSVKKLEMIIDAAESAPSQKNKSTIRIIMVKQRLKEMYLLAVDYMKSVVDKVGKLHPQYDLINELYDKREPILWGAEYAVIIVGRTGFETDAAIAAERMQLMAQHIGVSSSYNGNLCEAINSVENIQQMIGIKKNEKVLVAFALGYSAVDYSNPYILRNKKVEWI